MRIEFCVVSGVLLVNRHEQTSRSVNRKVIGRNKVKGSLAPKLNETWDWPTVSLYEEGSTDFSILVRKRGTPGFVPTACYQRHT